ncbi:glycosyltransferase [Protaetiibacter intestinalis]|uniref:glycosyltransferase n=1 Tax=Protaetiibacter intestinalis TaxID=2419774 RepID=UPI0013006555|nr:glycosyltransferase [Protaetiibacter intestinalis]
MLLIGGGAHKRNELAARVLARRPAWCKSVVGVGLSPQARTLLDDAYPGATEWVVRPTDEQLIDLYRSAEFFLFLGTEEGFGLPYIEALSSGCIVIAVDQPLTRELLGEAAVLVIDGDARDIESQLKHRAWPPLMERRKLAARFSWRAFAEHVRDELEATTR